MKVIISASRRTDIPAFFGKWFMRRIQDGFFYTVNPFNPKQVKGYSIAPEDVDVVVFWTKNPKPFMEYLDHLGNMGYRYYFQFTLNDYPIIFEPNVPPAKDRISTFKDLSERIGRERVIWRYDPIIVSSLTPIEYHIDRLNFLIHELGKYTNRLIISFVDYYAKVKSRFKEIGSQDNLELIDVTDISNKELLHQLCKSIAQVSSEHGLDVFTCSEKVDLEAFGIKHGSCIDAGLINNIFKTSKVFVKDKNQRKECLCAESIDMGVYNTCSFQCNYCYANTNVKIIQENLKRHNIASPLLIGEHDKYVEILRDGNREKRKKAQMRLFDGM